MESLLKIVISNKKNLSVEIFNFNAAFLSINFRICNLICSWDFNTLYMQRTTLSVYKMYKEKEGMAFFYRE